MESEKFCFVQAERGEEASFVPFLYFNKSPFLISSIPFADCGIVHKVKPSDKLMQYRLTMFTIGFQVLLSVVVLAAAR